MEPGEGRRRGGGRAVRIAAVLLLNVAAVYGLLGYLTGHDWLGSLLLLSALGTFLLARRWGLVNDPAFRAAWVAVAAAGAVLSVATGRLNGLTDEPYLTPAFATLWPNLYGHPVVVSYVQFGRTFVSRPIYDVYLPLLAFLRLPGIGYRATTVAAWGATVLLLRRRPEAVVLFGGLWAAVLAANGFNDFVPFLLLVLAFVTLSGAPAFVAEVVSLGVKQFANVLVVLLHLYRREWRRAAIAVGVTAAFLLPFALLAPEGVWCHAILIEPGSCSRGPGAVFGLPVLSHLNYPLWALFAAAIFGPGFVRSLRTAPPATLRARAIRRLDRLFPGPRRRPGGAVR